MNPNRGNRILSITALLSLLLACFFLMGYVGRFGPQLLWTSSDPLKTTYFLSFGAGRGQAQVILETLQGPLPVKLPWTWHGVRVDFRMSADDLKRVHFNSSFECRSILIGTPGQRVYLAACPIWFAMIPCLIAPAIWFHRRRRIPRPVGFPIEATK